MTLKRLGQQEVVFAIFAVLFAVFAIFLPGFATTSLAAGSQPRRSLLRLRDVQAGMRVDQIGDRHVRQHD